MRHNTEMQRMQMFGKHASSVDFVLEKSIFFDVFEKDIRRVFMYKKAERLAKAVHLILPAFVGSMSLKNRIDGVIVGLIDAAMLPPIAARTTLSRELLALSSMLSIARTSNLLSPMNTELIAHETHALLQEIAAYEEPLLSLEESPTFSSIAKKALVHESVQKQNSTIAKRSIHNDSAKRSAISSGKGHIKDRREVVLSVIRNKGEASIKDISVLVRNVSEKTIQRELQALAEEGKVQKKGERRWSTYSLTS